MLKIYAKSLPIYLFLVAICVIPSFAQRKNDITRIKRCQNIEKRIDQKIQTYNSNRDIHVIKYEKLQKRITAWINRLKVDGYDVTDLEAAMATLDAKLANVSSLHQEFIKKLENVKNYECGKSDGGYAQALTDAVTALDETRQGAVDIRNFYIDEIRPLIDVLRDQIAQNTVTTKSLDSEEIKSINF